MKTIDFVVRSAVGAVERGSIPAEEAIATVAVGAGQDVSLNLRQSDLRGYTRVGQDLQVSLADGRVIVLQGYFADGAANRLFLSTEGALNEVTFVEGSGGVLFADYGPTAEWGKWSPDDALIFVEGHDLADAAVITPAEDDQVSMLGAGLLGGTSLFGLAGPALAGGALLAATGGGGSGGSGGSSTSGSAETKAPPTVDEPETTILQGGRDETPGATITGTGEPGATVTVEVGGWTRDTTVNDDGSWGVTFTDPDYPDDGVYESIVTVTDPDGEVSVLDGPTVDIDFTPPEVTVEYGTVSTGDLVNADGHPTGCTIGGTSEPGALLTISAGEATHTVVVSPDGSWSVTFTPVELPGGEYDEGVTITATDVRGNSAITTDAIRIDTVPHPITIDESTIEVDGVVNADEHSDGVTITGTSSVGAVVTVTAYGTSLEAVTGPDGSWSVTFEPSVFATGEYDATITASTVDGAGNGSSTTGTIRIDTEGYVTIQTGVIEGDDVVNEGERVDDVPVSGTTEPGSTVIVTVQGTSVTATVDGSGSWTAVIPATTIATGEYTTTIEVTATDSAGNTSTTTREITIDTQTSVTIDSGLAGDDLVNALEAGVGFPITGTAEPGASLNVTFEGSSYTTVSGPDGTWMVSVPSVDIHAGTYDATISVTSTDLAGNSASTSTTLAVDTENAVSFDPVPVETDDVVNAAERSDGVTLTGTTEAGSSVVVTINGKDYTTTVTGTAWTVTIPAVDIPEGVATLTATATATDGSGNASTATRSFAVDTETSVTLDTGLAGGDDLVNAVDQAAGFAITGSAEPGSALVVTFQGQTYTTTATGSGTWSVTVPSSDIPTGTYGAPITVSATDVAGNTASTSGSVSVDTEGSVSFSPVPVETDGIVNAVERADGVTLTGATEPGSTVVVELAGSSRVATMDGSGNWSVTFLAAELPQGETQVTATANATDAAGNASSAELVIDIDTLVRDFAITTTTGGADGVLNAVEQAAGLSFGGTVEPGSTLVVQLGMVQRIATVDAAGNWSATFAATDIPKGEYTATLTATATDPAGNTSTLTQAVVIDTDAGKLAIDTAPIETDDIVNAVEQSDGVTITGTSDAGALVTVSLGAATQTVVTGPDGRWSATYAAAEIPEGTYEAEITATRTDAAGNVIDATDSVSVDTEVVNFALGADPAEFADALNHDELADGFTLTGTTEPGATLTVTIGTATRIASVDAAGNWSVDFAGSDLPQGEYEVTAVIDTTDRAGNTARLESTFAVDTLVNELTADAPPAVMNAAAVAGGLELTGTVEAGSTITVAFEGLAHAAQVDAAGNWSVLIPASAIPQGEYDADIMVYATDAAGNTDQIALADAIRIDTEAPDGPIVEAVNFDRSGDIRDISVEMAEDALAVGHVQPDGSISDLTPGLTLTDIGVIGETIVNFGQTVPDGSHLVVSHTDAAGNSSGTYLVVNESGTAEVSVGNPALGAHEIEAIDLSFAENSHLTITEAQLVALSSHSDQVKVYGGRDDSITIQGAVLTGTASEGGHDFNVYELGAGTLLVEDEIAAQTGAVI
ncbi:Ig-like domain-containing protein [Mesobacterium pallidum]|uniref:Ig-like domain-containing protein n=1 Tax=Mesobacterium pallidum TaxID=2872037 RepID=UPI001EE16A93|nr:Ig-like domain-containing protein [Mesobacterium pallidum]